MNEELNKSIYIYIYIYAIQIDSLYTISNANIYIYIYVYIYIYIFLLFRYISQLTRNGANNIFQYKSQSIGSKTNNEQT